LAQRVDRVFIPYIGDGDMTIYISSPRLTYKYKYLYCGISAVLIGSGARASVPDSCFDNTACYRCVLAVGI
jgi:hypothetical protein